MPADQSEKVANRLKSGDWDNARGILNECLQVILGRPVQRDDLKFEAIPGSDHCFQVDIATTSGRHRFQSGQPQKDRKEAKHKAVRAALEELGRAVVHSEEEVGGFLF